jgi:hypothetical protein
MKRRMAAALSGLSVLAAVLWVVPTTAQAWDTVDVPEPGMMALLALGLTGIATYRLRRRRR